MHRVLKISIHFFLGTICKLKDNQSKKMGKILQYVIYSQMLFSPHPHGRIPLHIYVTNYDSYST